MNILVLGDSHAGVFRYCNCKQSLYVFDVCEVGGATSLGVVNPNSKTNALPIFSNRLNNTITKDKVLIMLGEVDCGFVIWVRSARYNISVDEQLQTSVDNLFKFVKNDVIEIGGYRNKDVIIAGSIMPTISDNTDKKMLGGARSEVTVSQNIRTMKTLEYNSKLKQKCNENGYNYIDITNNILGSDGVVKSQYLNNNVYDHHLDNNKTYKLWIDQINAIH
jgi:hypothetical protein